LLKSTDQDISDAVARLRLLNSALEEMQIQLARLLPTEQEVAAPTWALPLVNKSTA